MCGFQLAFKGGGKGPSKNSFFPQSCLVTTLRNGVLPSMKEIRKGILNLKEWKHASRLMNRKLGPVLINIF